MRSPRACRSWGLEWSGLACGVNVKPGWLCRAFRLGFPSLAPSMSSPPPHPSISGEWGMKDADRQAGTGSERPCGS